MDEPQKCHVHNVFHPLGPTCTFDADVSSYAEKAKFISKDNIPVTFEKEMVGTAMVKEDGTVEITINNKELISKIRGPEFGYFSIGLEAPNEPISDQ